MALGDYILCSKCECKVVYDGDRAQRDWLEDRFKTRSLRCPDCLAELEAERDALREFADLMGWTDEIIQREVAITRAVLAKEPT